MLLIERSRSLPVSVLLRLMVCINIIVSSFIILMTSHVDDVYAQQMLYCKPISTTGISFGTVVPGQKRTASGSITIQCPVYLVGINRFANYRWCLYVDQMSDGGTGPSARYMDNGSGGRIVYSISAASSLLTSNNPDWGPAGGLTRVMRGNETVRDVTIPITAVIEANGVQSGSGSFNSKTARLAVYSHQYTSNPGMGNCGGGSLETLPISITANVAGDTCAIKGTGKVDFGEFMDFSINNDRGQGSITVNCTNDTKYSVMLATSAGITPEERIMYGSGNNRIKYALYKDVNRTKVWGYNNGQELADQYGSGSDQVIPVYGRIPPQSPAPAGSYSDTVVVIVMF